MPLAPFVRRHHVQITALLIASLLMSGCSIIIDRKNAPKQRVTFQPPEHAGFSADGDLLLSAYATQIDRPTRNGWHWIVVDAETLESLVEAYTQNPEQVSRLVLAGKSANTTVYPSVFSSGLDEPFPTPDAVGDMGRPLLIAHDEAGHFQLYAAGEDAPSYEAGPVKSWFVD